MSDDDEAGAGASDDANPLQTGSDKANPALPKQVETVLRSVPKEQQGLVLAVYQMAEFFRGPLPRPRDLRGYEEALPGSAERIVRMAEREQEHRHLLELQTAKEEVAYSRRGQWMAAVLFLLLVAAGTYVIAVKLNNVGGAVILGTMGATVIITFLSRRLSLFTNGDEDDEAEED